jgi:hypothetical protein
MNPKCLSATLALALVACAVPAYAQENVNALPWKMPAAYNAYLLREVHAQYAAQE